MTQKDLELRIEKKEAEIAKLERLYEKYSANNAEEKAIIDRFLETGNRDEYRAYLKSHNMWYGGDAWSKANDLYDARACLAKYRKQLETTINKDKSLAEIPEVIKEFKERLITRWDKYDSWKREQIKKEYHEKCEGGKTSAEYRQASRELREKWGMNYYEFAYYTTAEQDHKNNVNVAETLVLDLVNRTVEIAGQIVDASYLVLDRDNQGYSIINGIVIGTKGKARVESIGAGGYNIQRYHIRVLVKEVRA